MHFRRAVMAGPGEPVAEKALARSLARGGHRDRLGDASAVAPHGVAGGGRPARSAGRAQGTVWILTEPAVADPPLALAEPPSPPFALPVLPDLPGLPFADLPGLPTAVTD